MTVYRRLVAITVVILAGLVGLCLLGLHSLSLHAEGLRGRRLAEFAAVAEQIRVDVKRKLDDFVRAEQARPYTDYQYYYVPMAANEEAALVRSPVGDRIDNGLAYGYFQIDPDGTIITPYVPLDATDIADPEVRRYIQDDLQRRLRATLRGSDTFAFAPTRPAPPVSTDPTDLYDWARPQPATPSLDAKPPAEAPTVSKAAPKGSSRAEYRIGTLEETQQVQVMRQDRRMVEQNVMNRATRGDFPGEMTSQGGMGDEQAAAQRRSSYQYDEGRMMGRDAAGRTVAGSAPGPVNQRGRAPLPGSQAQPVQAESETGGLPPQQAEPTAPQREVAQRPGEPSATVSVRIEPFVSVSVQTADAAPFGYDVYLMRHVQIEQDHFVQGFRLNQEHLLAEVRDSAERLVRAGMDYRIAADEAAFDGHVTHTAILDFGFGSLALGLLELDPGRLGRELAALRHGYLGVMALVSTATLLALGALWHNVRAQVVLARKKDDFISAVSHELRTPLTSIRMYTEMLEKGWVRTEDKRGEYYGHMRHETERLSRLIENVLDFSRIQRGRKQYRFRLGDVNECIRQAVTMMQPCARQAGFEIAADLAEVPPFSFDPDAVVQIAVNLLDNAIKYAREATDRTLHIRSRYEAPWVTIEVEDHGPGIPRRQRGRVFDAFYRVGDESCRETTGTGLGLALVKRFAQAHGGSVQILTARPRGAVLRVRLAAQQPA